MFLLRVLEIKCFNNKLNANEIIKFIRDFRAVKKDEDTYINISRDRNVILKIKEETGLTNLDSLFFKEKEIQALFDNTIL